MKTAIILPVTQVGFYTAEEVMEFHILKEKQAKAVYFSTSNRIDAKKAELVDYVILVNKRFAYIGEKAAYRYFEKKSAPDDANIFAPDQFKHDQDLHWFKIVGLKEVNIDDLNAFEMMNRKSQLEYGGAGNYIKGTGRLQVFYAKQ